MDDFFKQEVKKREKESTILDSRQLFTTYKKRKRDAFEAQMKEEEKKWERLNKIFLSLDHLSMLQTEKEKDNKVPASFKLKFRVAVPKEFPLKKIKTLLKDEHCTVVDFSNLHSPGEWMKNLTLPLTSTCKVQCLLIQGQHLKTAQDITPLVEFAKKTKSLREIHLEN